MGKFVFVVSPIYKREREREIHRQGEIKIWDTVHEFEAIQCIYTLCNSCEHDKTLDYEVHVQYTWASVITYSIMY